MFKYISIIALGLVHCGAYAMQSQDIFHELIKKQEIEAKETCFVKYYKSQIKSGAYDYLATRKSFLDLLDEAPEDDKRRIREFIEKMDEMYLATALKAAKQKSEVASENPKS